MHNNETHSPEFESYEEAQAKVLECLPSYYQNTNILNEKKYLAELSARLRQYRQDNNEGAIEDVLEEISETKEDIAEYEDVVDELTYGFMAGALRPCTDDDWQEWLEAANIPVKSQPEKPLFFIENPESVNIPPVCGAPSFNVMMAKGCNINEFAETLYMETSHIDLYGWKGDGATPASMDNATYRILKSKCAWL